MELFLFWIVCGIAAAVVGSSKGRSGFGWFLIGIFLGPLALLMVGFMPALPDQAQTKQDDNPQFEFSKRCPFCAEDTMGVKSRVDFNFPFV
jgi:hypothetical protein